MTGVGAATIRWMALLASAAALLAPVPGRALDLNPLSAIKGAIEAAAEDRSSDDIAKDIKIKAKVAAEVIDKIGTDAVSINAAVYEQDVMLTGKVETAEQKDQAGKLTVAVEG